MLISEFVSELQKIKDEHGDLMCYVNSWRDELTKEHIFVDTEETIDGEQKLATGVYLAWG